MTEEIKQAIAGVVKKVFDTEVSVELSRPDEQFGDYATNVALQLGNKLGKNPREIGEALASSDKLMHALSDKVSEMSVAGPGFINLKLSDKALLASLDAQPAKSLEGQTVVTEYSDPNPFKPLHAGHLYTTLVGDTISRLVENAGAQKTIRINYGGDVGLHVGRCMWGLLKNIGGELPEQLLEVPPEERPAWLGKCYVEGTAAYENDEKAKAEIIELNKKVYELHAADDHDTPFAQIYWAARAWSYEYFEELYKQLKVKPFDRFIPESEVTPLGVEAVKEHTRGAPENKIGPDIFFYSSAGDQNSQTIVFHGENVNKNLHTRVFINSEGLPTYETKDVGLSLTKWKDYKFDQSIIITANEQAQYMQVVLAAIKQFAPELAERTRHLTHGVVKLQGGVKMSSRTGNVVTALEILDAAHEAAKATGREVSEDTVLAAVKYAFAKNRIGGDIIYDPTESIALEGNSGPYLQYAHARARSILSKAGSEPDGTIENLEQAERSLVRKMSEYAETVERSTNELMPHHICTYLYELAQTFNSFYEHNRVIGDSRQDVRVNLVMKYADTLKSGLTLLGITAPDKM